MFHEMCVEEVPRHATEPTSLWPSLLEPGVNLPADKERLLTSTFDFTSNSLRCPPEMRNDISRVQLRKSLILPNSLSKLVATGYSARASASVEKSGQL